MLNKTEHLHYSQKLPPFKKKKPTPFWLSAFIKKESLLSLILKLEMLFVS